MKRKRYPRNFFKALGHPRNIINPSFLLFFNYYFYTAKGFPKSGSWNVHRKSHSLLRRIPTQVPSFELPERQDPSLHSQRGRFLVSWTKIRFLKIYSLFQIRLIFWNIILGILSRQADCRLCWIPWGRIRKCQIGQSWRKRQRVACPQHGNVRVYLTALLMIYFFKCLLELKFDFSEECLKKKCEYYFNVDALAHIDNPHTLKLLIEQNRPVVAPMMVFIWTLVVNLPFTYLKMWFFTIQIRPYQAWSNFWGSLTTDGFYARSIDYMEIVKGERRWEILLLNQRFGKRLFWHTAIYCLNISNTRCGEYIYLVQGKQNKT